MASKTTFTPTEWNTLGEAIQLTALAVTVSGASGIFGTIAEALATSATLVEGMKSENELVRSLCVKEELQATQQGLRDTLKSLSGSDLKASQARLKELSLERVRAALEIVTAKGSAGDLAAYRFFLKAVADKIASAAKEGSFLGFGGERVSAGERQMLADLDQALGALRA